MNSNIEEYDNFIFEDSVQIYAKKVKKIFIKVIQYNIFKEI